MDNRSQGDEKRRRRFRLSRKVQQPMPQTREEQEMKALAAAADDADRGTPEQDLALRQGCTSIIKLVGFFFVVMAVSIIATCAIRK